jgi:hypothetical protein
MIPICAWCRSSSSFMSIRGPISLMTFAPSASQSLRAKNSALHRQAHHEVPANARWCPFQKG